MAAPWSRCATPLTGAVVVLQVFDQELDALGVEAVCDALNGGGCGAAGV